MGSNSPEYNRRLECLIIGGAAVVLALGGLLTIGMGAAWEIRFPLIAAASIFGPAIPALRLYSSFTLLECLVYGIGVDVALLMLISLGLVMAHAWVPATAVFVLLLTSLAAGARLIMISAST
jgi:hypothetical protein